ncbi:hypothetical protein LWI29_028789 [Acer saccharum]|uniref:DUF4408 domain-containing protein n=1 Tax=Acer saccharum TaxID=4024 RepID=A0AA39VDN7_ACESA|nr:hypothetical protein LWI29_028789 [Acer saccharum]KAK1560060.1 hypothetical protein Q3G72_021738 [Acer saccharum]
MDSFRINNIQVEKANAIMKHHRQLRKMANWFRLIEICVVLLVVSRFSSQLPLAVKNSGGYFRELTVFIVSPRFVFVVGNLIVITLFAKSGQFSAQDSPGKNSGSDLIKEFVEKSEKTQNIHRQEIEYREKQSTCIEKVASDAIKHYKRSQSENLRRVSCYKPCRELRRSETEKCTKISNSGGEKLVKKSNPEDEMSNEEFRRTIEAFIAKQQKFRREEEYSVI